LVAGRVLAESLVASVAFVILIVILGLRSLNGTGSSIGATNNPFLNVVTSTLFLALIPAFILVGIVVVEIAYRRRSRRTRAAS
jgi:hypothetical protein